MCERRRGGGESGGWKCDWKGGEEGSRWEVMMEEVEEFLSRKQGREKDCPQVSTNLEKYSKIRK